MFPLSSASAPVLRGTIREGDWVRIVHSRYYQGDIVRVRAVRLDGSIPSWIDSVTVVVRDVPGGRLAVFSARDVAVVGRVPGGCADGG